MADLFAILDTAMGEVTKARALILKDKAALVRRRDELDQLTAVSYAWFQTHRSAVIQNVPEAELADVDAAYQRILNSTARATVRKTYVVSLKAAKDALASLRTRRAVASPAPGHSRDTAPDFSKLAADQVMQEILVRRWHECQRCVRADAPLAATVMMGGLLEALCLARVNIMPDKAPAFKATTAPLDFKTKKALPLQEWTLRHYLDVAHELKWLTRSGKDVGVVLRDYRNYIHPQKEYSHGVVLVAHDATMFWDVTKSLCRQLLAS
jgi:hypothetical protein